MVRGNILATNRWCAYQEHFKQKLKVIKQQCYHNWNLRLYLAAARASAVQQVNTLADSQMSCRISLRPQDFLLQILFSNRFRFTSLLFYFLLNRFTLVRITTERIGILPSQLIPISCMCVSLFPRFAYVY